MSGLDLTGDGNEPRLLQLLGRALTWASGSKDCVSVMLVVLDPAAGAPIDGDAEHLLLQVARQLVTSVGPMDTVVRLPGPAFGVILAPTSDGSYASRIAARVLQAGQVSLVAGGPPAMTVSVGVAQAPADGRDASTLLGYALVAVGEARADGGNRVCVYSAAIAARAAAYRRFGVHAPRPDRERGPN